MPARQLTEPSPQLLTLAQDGWITCPVLFSESAAELSLEHTFNIAMPKVHSKILSIKPETSTTYDKFNLQIRHNRRLMTNDKI